MSLRSASGCSGARLVRLSGLQAEEREALAACPSWFGSLDFCELFATPPAEAAFLRFDEGGRLTRAHACRESRLPAGGRMLTLFGADDLGPEEVTSLLRRYGAVSLENLATAERFRPGGTVLSRTQDDYIITLPDSARDYLAQLGKKTRKHLLYYERRLERECGETRTDILETAAIPVDLVRQLAHLSGLRMEAKGRKSLWTETMIRRRAQLASRCGLMCLIRRDGRILAGTLSYRHGAEAYLTLIAHDPALDDWNLGNIALWRTIQALIERGTTRYHLLWGRASYKTQFAGAYQPLHHVVAFRTASGRRLWAALRWLDRAARLSARLAGMALDPRTWSLLPRRILQNWRRTTAPHD